MRAMICFVGTLLLWLGLFGPEHWSTWSVWAGGMIGAFIIGAAVGKFYPAEPHKVLQPRRWFFAAVYLPYFAWFVVRANLDVMLRVLHPDVPIRPGIVKVRTKLKSQMAKTFLANSISLTPGTLTLDIDGQDLYVHWLTIDTDDPAKRQARIVDRYEGLLRRIFE